MIDSPTKIFIAYSRDDNEYLKSLRNHLKPICKANNIIIQSDGEILPGQIWGDEISHFLNTADIVVLLISSSFMNSDYIINVELPKSLERERLGECKVIPVIVRPCAGWDQLIFNQALPKDGKPISLWNNEDSAFVDVVRGIERAVQNLRVADKETLFDESKAMNESFYYKAFFYTYRKHETREVDFEINITNGKIQVKVIGLHFDDDTEEDTGEEYLGFAEKAGNRLFINLDICYPESVHGPKEPKKLHIILQFGNKKLGNHYIIIGVAQWVSSYGYPVSAEILLFKLNKQGGFISDENLTKIRRYMMFKRSMRRVPNRLVDIPDDLMIKTNRLDQLSDIVGVYRVWTYYKEGIVQSRFTIKPNFDTTFETKTYGKESGDTQVCLLNISTIQGRQRICMSHHPKIGTEILAYSIIDIPFEDIQLTKGVFCSMGRQSSEHQHCGWMVLKREPWNSGFDIGVYPIEKLNSLIQAQPDLKELLKLFNQHSDIKIKTKRVK